MVTYCKMTRQYCDQIGREIAEMPEGIEVGGCAGRVAQGVLGIEALKGDEYFKKD